MSGFDGFKSKITYENKTIFGVVGLIVGFLFWGIGHPAIGIGDVLILIFPCILLLIPSPTIKNSKILAIISMIILLLLLFVGISSLYAILTQYVPDSWAFQPGYVETMLLADVLQLILCIYGLFCAFLLTVQTEPKTSGGTSIKNANLNNEIKFDKYCSKCGHGLLSDSKFCPGCGVKVINDIPKDVSQDSEDENGEKVCSKCGHELYDDSKFCPECGAKLDTADENV